MNEENLLDKTKVVYEDELLEMSDKDYAIWFKNSWVDFVRMGYALKEQENEFRL